MADIVRHVNYYYTEVANQAAVGAKVLNVLKAGGANLIVYNGFPISSRRAQLVFVPVDQETLCAAAKKAGIKLVGPNTAFLIQGEDRLGAIADALSKLGRFGINVTAIQAIAAGEGSYGAIIWVKRHNIDKAGKALGVSQ